MLQTWSNGVQKKKYDFLKYYQHPSVKGYKMYTKFKYLWILNYLFKWNHLNSEVFVYYTLSEFPITMIYLFEWIYSVVNINFTIRELFSDNYQLSNKNLGLQIAHNIKIVKTEITGSQSAASSKKPNGFFQKLTLVNIL